MKRDPCAPMPPAIVQQQRKRVDAMLKRDLQVRLSQTKKALVVMHEKRARILGDLVDEKPDYTKLVPKDEKPKRKRKPKTPTGILGGAKARATVGPNPLRMNNRTRKQQKDSE